MCDVMFKWNVDFFMTQLPGFFFPAPAVKYAWDLDILRITRSVLPVYYATYE